MGFSSVKNKSPEKIRDFFAETLLLVDLFDKGLACTESGNGKLGNVHCLAGTGVNGGACFSCSYFEFAHACNANYFAFAEVFGYFADKAFDYFGNCGLGKAGLFSYVCYDFSFVHCVCATFRYFLLIYYIL